MRVTLENQTTILNGEIFLNGSKSISNRLLMLNRICGNNFEFENLCFATDTKTLQQALISSNDVIDIGNCGTAMRFLTAYYAFGNKTITITGDDRMKQRPIKALVDALVDLGANIEYQNNIGFPPLKIFSAKPIKNSVVIDASVSSQYISALMMIAPLFDDGLEIELIGKIVSIPYIKLTLELMLKFGISVYFESNKITIKPLPFSETTTMPKFVEGDWSNASYWYNAVALSKQSSVTIFGLQQNSLQGDCVLPHIYSFFGVNTQFIENRIILSKINFETEFFIFDFSNNPDLAQSVAVTCAGLKIPCILNGLETLNIKETNRIEALANELTVCGVKCIAQHDSLQLFEFNFNGDVKTINTYKDHRMAMSFLPLCNIFPVQIIDATVVEKSYPNYYNDAAALGYRLMIND